jgi:hypothetical protein
MPSPPYPIALGDVVLPPAFAVRGSTQGPAVGSDQEAGL